MKIEHILTDRHYATWPSWQIVFEWENEISNLLNIKLKNSQIPTKSIGKLFKKIDNKLFNGKLSYAVYKAKNKNNDLSLYFEMRPIYKRNFSNDTNTIPVIIDFWERDNIDKFKKYYGQCPCLLVTNLEVVDFLKENNFPTEVIHFPMCLPSIYKLEKTQNFEKKYDLVLAGRTNPVLLDFLNQYEEKHPDFEYLSQTLKDNELYYQSNKKGIIGKFQSRTEYYNLIKSAKISFYSTPGIDGGKIKTKGFNPVTPRFFELLSAGCHVIGRYPKSRETDFFNLETICPSVNTYEEFEYELDKALKTQVPIKRNAEYLSNHYLSKRIQILETLLSK